MKVIGEAKAEYRLSIEGFALTRVRSTSTAAFRLGRLNFFVDEAASFTVRTAAACSSLQTVVESPGDSQTNGPCPPYS